MATHASSCLENPMDRGAWQAAVARIGHNLGTIQPVHPKGDQSWVFTRRTDAEAETPILWPPDAKS